MSYGCISLCRGLDTELLENKELFSTFAHRVDRPVGIDQLHPFLEC